MLKDENEYYKNFSGQLTPCQGCQHLTYLGGPDGKDSTCEAFQKGGIPFPIFSGEVEHNKPYNGDGGFRYLAKHIQLQDGTYAVRFRGWIEKVD